MAIALAATLSSSLCTAVFAQQQPSVPDAPTPQAPVPLAGADGSSITPGKGAGDTPSAPSSSSSVPAQQPASQPKDQFQATPPEEPVAGEGVASTARFVVNVNFVEVPVTVKDNKGKLVAGLTYRDFKVFENDQREPLRLFTVDPFPLSIAFA